MQLTSNQAHFVCLTTTHISSANGPGQSSSVLCRWLVGISYRVMFRRDPIPLQSTVQAKNGLRHVHGAVYICGESMRPGHQPKASFEKADYADHSAQAYMGALDVHCKRQLDREKSTGMHCDCPLTMTVTTTHFSSARSVCYDFFLARLACCGRCSPGPECSDDASVKIRHNSVIQSTPGLAQSFK